MPPAAFSKERSKPDPGRPPSGAASLFLKVDIQERLRNTRRSSDDIQAWMTSARGSSGRQVTRTAIQGSRRSSIQDGYYECQDCYPDVLDLTNVGGNFELDWEAMAKAAAKGAPRKVITRGKTYGGIASDPKTGEPYPPPTMLIPWVRGRARSAIGEMFGRVRSPSVMAVDSLTPFILASNIQQGRPNSVPPEFYSPGTNNTERLDSFAGLYDAVDAKRRPRSAQQPDELSHLEASVTCPQCRHILKHTKYKKFLLQWFKGQLELLQQQQELQLFPESGSQSRADKPHFCNFVRKAKLFNKADEVPPPTHSKDHLRRRHDSLEDLSSFTRRHNQRYALRHGSRHRSQEELDASSNGHQGRPGSPDDIASFAQMHKNDGSHFVTIPGQDGQNSGFSTGQVSGQLIGQSISTLYGDSSHGHRGRFDVHGGVSSADVTRRRGHGDGLPGKPAEAWAQKGVDAKSTSSSGDTKGTAIVIPRALTSRGNGREESEDISAILQRLGTDETKGGTDRDGNNKSEKGKRKTRSCVHKKEKKEGTKRSSRKKVTRSPSPEADEPEVMLEPLETEGPKVTEVTPSVEEWNRQVYQRVEIPRLEEKPPVVIAINKRDKQLQEHKNNRRVKRAEEKAAQRVLPKAEFGRAKADLAERLDETLAKARQNDSDMSSEISSESQDSQNESYARRNSLNIQLCKTNHFQRPTRIAEPEDWKAEVAAEKLTNEQQTELGGRHAIMQMLYPGYSPRTKTKDTDKHKDKYRDKEAKAGFAEPKAKIPPWSFGRLALSQQSCRFELPMNMFELEDMSVQDYLRKHCVVSSHRIALYQRVFIKNKEKGQHITHKELEKALIDILVNRLSQENVTELYQTVQIDEGSKIDFNLFCGVCALAERIYYPQFLEDMKALKRTEETMDLAERQKDKIECADLGSLAWKFHGVNVNPGIKKILDMI